MTAGLDGAGPVPGAFLLRPAPLAAWGVIAVNAFVLQPYWPGRVSGLLGDLGTCFLFPLLLVATVEWGRWGLALWRGTPWRPAGAVAVSLSCVLAASYYAGLELSPAVVELHRRAMATLTGMRVTVTRDPWDLLALPLVAVAWVWLRRLAGPTGRP